MLDLTTVADVLRIIVVILFGLTLGETAAIFRSYFKVAAKIRRLLPLHIIGISVGLLMLEFYVAFITVTERMGTSFSWLAVYSLVALALVYAALLAIRKHVTPKAQVSRDMESLLEDPNFLP